jgi:hypothetical protein
MQERRASFRHELAELVERDVLPLLNLMVLLLPIVLLGIEFVAHSAIAVTLPDPSPDVASLDTPPAPRPRAVGSADHGEARSHLGARGETPREQVVHEPTPTATSVFSGSPLGYGD